MTDAERRRRKASNFWIKNEQSHDSLMLVCFSREKELKPLSQVWWWQQRQAKVIVQ